jgi:hypothetical protein
MIHSENVASYPYMLVLYSLLSTTSAANVITIMVYITMLTFIYSTVQFYIYNFCSAEMPR